RVFRAIWWWRTDRIIRGDLAGAYLSQVVDALGIEVQSAMEGRVDAMLLPIYGGAMGKREARGISERVQTGRRSRVTVHGAPPTGQVAHGWRATGHMGKPDEPVRLEHDPAVMPTLFRMLWGLRHEGW